MEIFVSIDGVLRNTIQKFDYHYKDYFLSFIDTDLPLSIIYGKDETVQWKLMPKTETNINDKYGEYHGEDYIAQQITILSDIKNSLIDKISLTVLKYELTVLQDTIRNNFDLIAEYMQTSLEYSKNLYDLSKANSSSSASSSAKAGGNSVTSSGINLSNADIGTIVITISNMKVYYVNLINLEINKINQQLILVNIQEAEDKYNDFLNEIESKITIIKNNISQNQSILGRQTQNYNQFDDDEIYIQNKKQNYDKLDKQLKVNLNIATDNSNQSSYLAKIYPFIIIILLLLLIYLIYLTVIKFKTNIYDKY